MRHFIVFCVLASVAFSSVHSASYFRNVREVDIAAVPEIVKDVIVSELKKDEIPVVIETDVPVVKDEVVVPVEPMRSVEPAASVQEPAVVVNEVVKVNADPLAELTDSLLRQTNQGSAPVNPPANQQNLLEQFNVLTADYANRITNAFANLFRPSTQNTQQATQAAAVQPVNAQSDSDTQNAENASPPQQGGGIFSGLQNLFRPQTVSNTAATQTAGSDSAVVQRPTFFQQASAQFTNAQNSLNGMFDRFQSIIQNAFARPQTAAAPAAAEPAAPPAAPAAPAAVPVSLADEAAPVEVEFQELKSVKPVD